MLIEELKLVREWYAVAVYDETQEYGGPEEGGWWYMTGELVGVAHWFYNEDVAYEVARGYNERFEKESWNSYKEGFHARVVEVPRRELKEKYADDACHSDGDWPDYAYEMRWDVPTYWPERRPHYC